MAKLPTQGQPVKFLDGPDGAGDIAHGTVNGEPVTCAGGERTYLPVWVDSRPGGREGTTIYVNVKNIR
jgi:hypothetical protein